MSQEEINASARDARQQMSRIDIENSPFSAIENAETKKCMLAIGNQIIVEEEFESVDATKEYVNSKPWELILNASALFTEFCINHRITGKEYCINNEKKEMEVANA